MNLLHITFVVPDDIIEIVAMDQNYTFESWSNPQFPILTHKQSGESEKNDTGPWENWLLDLSPKTPDESKTLEYWFERHGLDESVFNTGEKKAIRKIHNFEQRLQTSSWKFYFRIYCVCRNRMDAMTV